MQRVLHTYRNQSRIFNILEGLYAYISDTDRAFDDVLWTDTSFAPLCRILQEHLADFNPPVEKPLNLPKISPVHVRPREITVCLSGGKDSAACAFYYIQQGYIVHLYHAAGVNKAYGDEKQAAEKIAKYLGCDLYIDKIHLEGKNVFIEHPLKNYVIANGAIHYCLYNGYTPRIAFGNFRGSSLEDNEFEVCAGDCIEMWDAYRPIVQSVLPEFEIEIPLQSNADTFWLLRQDWELFKLSVSCMSPYRFRAHWKHRTEEKYNVRVFENRCGCCWKCCVEWMWLADTGNVEFNEAYYIHCFEILERTIIKETGEPAESIQEVWDQYMFYPIEKSKAYDKLVNKKLLRRAY